MNIPATLLLDIGLGLGSLQRLKNRGSAKQTVVKPNLGKSR